MFQHLPGFRDFYPQDCRIRHHLFREMRFCAEQFGFEEYDAPVLEPLELFTTKSGEEIEQQLFGFSDRGGRAVALRPEMTPSLVRMVGAKISSLKKPIRWFSIAEQFRYERPQKGRLRSFFQLNADILGEESIAAEAEIIALGIHTLQKLGLIHEDFHVRLSDRQLWALFLKANGLPPELIPPVLGIIDKMGRERSPTSPAHLAVLAPEISSGAWEELFQRIGQFRSLQDASKLSMFLQGQAVDPYLRSAIGQRLEELELLLSRLEIMGYRAFITLDFSIVRGLAYYTGFIFEFFERQDGTQENPTRALAGGGHYDELFQKFGYSPLPAVGLAIGDVPLLELLSKKEKLPPVAFTRDISLLFDSLEGESSALSDATALRRMGYAITYTLQKGKTISRQLKQMEPGNATWICLYEAELLLEQKVVLRHFANREERILPRENLLRFLSENFPKRVS
ncbi:MAG: ATP phosphoribosyltransferase regulatory subunit [Puniceicoccales bacterium]|jgi:histidyl-tRNA synthetase|nr:ATP phosphoribosyltransferase regulatory subunit [Puniceicoccales bacterium]